MSMLKNIQEIKIDINEKCLKPLIIVIEKVFTTLPNEEVECCKVVIESLETQYQNMNKIFNLSNDKLNIIYEQWLYYTTQINEIYQAIRILKLNVENIISCSVDFSFEVTNFNLNVNYLNAVFIFIIYFLNIHPFDF